MDNTKHNILVSYGNYILKYNERPKSVYLFSEKINISESDFYESFSSFQMLEKQIFVSFYENTLKLILEFPDYMEMNSTDKILTFYYTYFQILTENRSLVQFLFENNKSLTSPFLILSAFQKCFLIFISGLNFKITGFSNFLTENVSSHLLPKVVWLQFLAIFKFWMNDSSIGFEKTDVFIEKTVRAGNDLIDLSKYSSVLDLGKFLYHEKLKM